MASRGPGYELAGEAEDVDLSDLAVVILNVETQDGRQLSMVWACEDGHLELAEGDVATDSQGFGSWPFTVRKTM